MSTTIVLTVKAANGSVDDFRVDAEADWTVHQVKKHLYRHYPTHPPLTSQKLIFRGHVLLDHQTLAQSLPVTDDVIIIHLVAYQRSHSSPTGLSSESQRISKQPSLTPVEESPTSPAETPSTPAAAPPNNPASTETSNQNTMPGYNEWLRYRGNFPPQMQQHPGYPAQFYNSPYGAAYAHQMMAFWYHQNNNTYGRQAPVEGEEDDNLLRPPAPGQEVEIEDNVPVNAAGGAAGLGMMAGGAGGGGQRGRDLVDILYMSTMLAFLALVAYITGSLGRLLVFAGGVVFMLLNQGGFFALRRRRHVAPVNDENPLNRAEQLPARQQEEQQPDNQPVPDNQPPPPEPREQPDNRPGILATLFVFVTSFFTSLVPHQRPEFQAQ